MVVMAGDASVDVQKTPRCGDRIRLAVGPASQTVVNDRINTVFFNQLG